MKRLKEINTILRELNGTSARYKKTPTDETEGLLKEQLTRLKTVLNEVTLD